MLSGYLSKVIESKVMVGVGGGKYGADESNETNKILSGCRITVALTKFLEGTCWRGSGVELKIL